MRLPAIAEENESFVLETPTGFERYSRSIGEVLHPERESAEVLAEIKNTQGSFVFAGQYQQSPMPQEGGIVKRSWIQYYDRSELPADMDVIQSWDTASKSGELADYSVCTTWGIADGKFYLLDVFKRRMDFPTLVRAAIELNSKYCPSTILVEDASSGTQLVQQLMDQGMTNVRAIKAVGEKVMRMHTQTVSFENGNVLLPNGAPWLEDYLKELLTFPKAKNDDQVDSTSQALGWLAEAAREPGIIAFYREEYEKLHGVGKTPDLTAINKVWG